MREPCNPCFNGDTATECADCGQKFTLMPASIHMQVINLNGRINWLKGHFARSEASRKLMKGIIDKFLKFHGPMDCTLHCDPATDYHCEECVFDREFRKAVAKDPVNHLVEALNEAEEALVFAMEVLEKGDAHAACDRALRVISRSRGAA